jgi:integrase
MHLDFNAVTASAAIRTGLKHVLKWYVENESPSHVANLFSRFKHFAASVRLGEDITSTELINYKTTLDGATGWYLGTLSGLLKRWYALCIPGVGHDAANLLRSIRIKGNRKGQAVLTMDPEQGRFTDMEFEAILDALKAAYQRDEIEEGAYVLALLFIALGPRPIQYAALKIRDLQVLETSDGKTYLLSVPRAKRREQMARSSFTRRTLIPEIGELVRAYADEVKKDFEGVLPDPTDAPMFPAKIRTSVEPKGFEYHRTSLALIQWFRLTTNKLLVHSERTGGPIKMTATRFRRTLGCRAADEGQGELVIAELLDHTDTQNVGVYVEATPGMMERIDRAVALKLAPLAQAFAGTIITDESQATRANDPTSRIRDPRFDSSAPVGNCGQFGFCSFLAPVACYTCRSFEPWLDGPHERVLEFLIKERDRLLVQADKRVASINDRTILAVADVVGRCAEIKGEPIGDLNG